MANEKAADLTATTSRSPGPELVSSNSTSFEKSQTSFPNFMAIKEVHKIPSRNAGRLNAASIDQEELAALLEERSSLVDKMLAKTATKREIHRLEYVRWSLDRIEDAQYGEHLDEVEGWVERMEFFAKSLSKFETQLVGQMVGKSNRLKK